MVNAFPNFANNDVNGSEFTPKEHDTFLRYQLGQENPKIISPVALRLVGVAAEDKGAKKTLQKLYKLGVLEEDSPVIHTDLIQPGFTHALAHLPATRQKKLINLLFTWEEELMRWRLIEEEEAEIRQVMAAAASADGQEGEQDMQHQFAVRLKELEGQWHLLPSLRTQEAKDTTVLPGYQARASV